LVLENGQLGKRLTGDLESLVLGALRRGEVPALELTCLDLLTLANRLSWGQLVELLGTLENRQTLATLADIARARPSDFPMLYAGALLSRGPQPVVDYVVRYGEAGVGDVRQALRFGE